MFYYHGHQIPASTEEWEVIPDTDDSDELDRGIREHWKLWNFLHQFFSSHGYHLYDFDPTKTSYDPRPPKTPVARHDKSDVWPWARTTYVDERDITFLHVDVRGIKSFQTHSISIVDRYQKFGLLVGLTDEKLLFGRVRAQRTVVFLTNHTATASYLTGGLSRMS